MNSVVLSGVFSLVIIVVLLVTVFYGVVLTTTTAAVGVDMMTKSPLSSAAADYVD